MLKVTPTKQILVYADDDEDDLQLVKEAMNLYSEAIDLCLFQSGNGAYKFLLELERKDEMPCLIILDMNMPGMSGSEILPRLRSRPFFAEVPIILFTTSSMQHDYSFALRYNAGFITKPMTYRQMDVIADEFLSHCSTDLKSKIQQLISDRKQ